MCRIAGFIDFSFNNSYSLEGREPFLDHRMVEWTSQLPVEFKYKSGASKYLLRKVLYKYTPKELMEIPKQGFAVPIYEWFKGELNGLYKQYLSLERIKKEGLFNYIHLHPSLKEVFGIVVLEAMIVGLPVVIFREIYIEEFGNNILVANNEEEFVSYVRQLVESKSFREEVGSKLKQDALKLDIRKVAEKYLEVF